MYLLRTSCGWSTALGTGEMQQRRGDESEDPEHLGCSGPGAGNENLFNLHHKPHKVAMAPILQMKLIHATQ